MTEVEDMGEPRFHGYDGYVAVVTGGARGIGLAIATAFHRQGTNVAVLDLAKPSEGDHPASSERWMSLRCDITDETQVDACFTEIERRFGHVSILVNNAGILQQKPLATTTLKEWRRMFDVNLHGAFLCTKRALPNMAEGGYGRVLSIGSSAGKTGGYKHLSAYAASKAALMSLARSIASEYAEHGITSNALAPAAITTDMVADLEDFSDQIPVGRMGTPEDVALLALTYCSSHADYITGEVTDVNGGFLID